MDREQFEKFKNQLGSVPTASILIGMESMASYHPSGLTGAVQKRNS